MDTMALAEGGGGSHTGWWEEAHVRQREGSAARYPETVVPRGKRCRPVNLKDRQQQEWPKDQTQDPKRLAFSYKKVICIKIKV